MTKKLQDSTSMNTSMGSNINMNANNGKSSKKKKSTAPFVTETNPFVNHSRTNLNASKPPAHQKIEPKLPTNETPVVKKPREEDTMSRATSHGSHLNYTRAYSNRSMSKQSMLSGATVRTEYSNKILNLELLKPKPKPEPQKFTTDANPFVNSSRNMLNSAESKTSINEKKKLDITQQSQDPVMQKINTWQMKNKELNSSSDRLQASYSHIDAPFVTNQSAMNITRSEIGSPFPKDITKSDIGFMMAEPFENRFSLYMKNTLTKLNVLIFLFFLVVLIILLVSLISPYWLVMKEPWIERLPFKNIELFEITHLLTKTIFFRFLIPKQYILDPEKTNAWIGLFSSCNTENRCASGTPYDDRGFFTFHSQICTLLIAFNEKIPFKCCNKVI